MNSKICITLNNEKYEVEKKTTLLELSRRFKNLYKSAIVAARVNNDIKD